VRGLVHGNRSGWGSAEVLGSGGAGGWGDGHARGERTLVVSAALSLAGAAMGLRLKGRRRQGKTAVVQGVNS
jgi:hypothetical protein